MSYARIIIDGKTMLDGELDHWQQQPPEFIMELVNKEHGRERPWLKYAGGALAEAVTQNKPVTITLTTQASGDWAMAVNYTPALSIAT